MPVFKKALFVDDDVIAINISERLLTFNGFAEEVVAKTDGEQAKAFLLHNKADLPDIIFVDLYMSIMSGVEFIKWLNTWQAKENLHVPVYVLSSSMSIDDFNLVSKHQISGYIVKPLTSGHLKEITTKHANKLHHFLKLY
ncbi:response regulator [Parafilimonas terrae]|uniref:CheY chemotaxis protein or a CheY-like REC (Receiver) domain n=1 Tax=Parafilimonas terrae TaxID=1465490 RepID=A0A1I5W912_9BACT|nr:response regulator [Parafilimonas terrae]SFQ16173.1 CheY chemotaxis protein or a CheY-like REC (receiver) domain [Parafilimonas terrae]